MANSSNANVCIYVLPRHHDLAHYNSVQFQFVSKKMSLQRKLAKTPKLVNYLNDAFWLLRLFQLLGLNIKSIITVRCITNIDL